jgi:hypothetical protein
LERVHNKLTMSKPIVIKLTFSGPNAGPFDILDVSKDVLRADVSREELINGIVVNVDPSETLIVIRSKGECQFDQTVVLEDITMQEYQSATYTQDTTGCIWRHLTNTTIYNYYYGNIEPFVLEYPFAYKYQDEILQNVKDYTKVYKYLPSIPGTFDTNRKIETDNEWYNKAILYNGQQCSGVLNLVPKPANNLSAYMQYPILNTDSKTITFTKSDSFYQYNTFWALQKDDEVPMFRTSCKSLSVDKVINQDNMDYGNRSFKKATLRAKNLKVRHILDNSSTTHIISQFIVTPAQISYK